jgi:hypothetical protein
MHRFTASRQKVVLGSIATKKWILNCAISQNPWAMSQTIQFLKPKRVTISPLRRTCCLQHEKKLYSSKCSLRRWMTLTNAPVFEMIFASRAQLYLPMPSLASAKC